MGFHTNNTGWAGGTPSSPTKALALNAQATTKPLTPRGLLDTQSATERQPQPATDRRRSPSAPLTLRGVLTKKGR